MKILYILPYVPSRIRVRPFQIIKELSKRHEVHVIALGETGVADELGINEIADAVKTFLILPHSKKKGYIQSVCALMSSSPMCAAFCKSSDMKKAVENAVNLENFDIIHIEHLRAAHFLPKKAKPKSEISHQTEISHHPEPVEGCTPIESAKCTIPTVFDSVDCLSSLFSQMVKSKKNPLAKLVALEETIKLRKYEPKIAKTFGITVITSESEKQEMLNLDSSLDIEILENGVDTDYFATMQSKKYPKRIIFSGKMSYHPNAQAAIWFAHNVYGKIREKWQDAQFFIVGSEPSSQIRQLSEIEGITVTGYVEDIRPYLDSSVVAVAPMQVAVGIQNKALEAMAMGVPVIASKNVTRTFNGRLRGIIEANTPEEYVEILSDLFLNQTKREELGRMAREDVCEKQSWQSCAAKLESIYERLVSS
jgi:glycosyltransferase involved in cell wall biosynthesis